MRNLFLLLFLFGNCSNYCQSKKIKAEKISSTALQADSFIGFDVLGNCYFIKGDRFFKKNPNESFEYKNISLGKIAKVDIQNPLKIVLFYENFNTIILLDNQLNETQKINFSESPIPIVVAATGIASQNQLWIYNRLDQQIGLFNYLKNNYNPISTPFPENIKHYQSAFNYFCWIDNKNNWYACDIFGRITPKGKIPDFDLIEIIDNHQIIYSKNAVLFFEDIDKKEKHIIEIAEKTFKNFYYKDQILSIFTSEGIINYKITTP